MQMRTSGRDVDFLIELTLCFIEIGIVHSDSFSKQIILFYFCRRDVSRGMSGWAE